MKIIKKIIVFLTIISLVVLPTKGLTFNSQTVFGYEDLIVEFSSTLEGLRYLNNNFDIVDFDKLFSFSTKNELAGFYKIKIKSGFDIKKINHQSIKFVERDEKIEVAISPNDEFFTTDPEDINRQWYLPKIDALNAWGINKNASNVIVAVVDTGINAKHQDLNDGRVIAGYKTYCESLVNDVCQSRVQEDILANSNSDDNGHGTSVASVLGAITNNQIGVAAVAWNVKLMPVKVLNSQGVGTASDVAEGIVWAAQHQADIVNLSLGGANLPESNIFEVAAKIATDEDTLIIAAAGNDSVASDGVDLDKNPSDPICSDGDQNFILGVAATNYLDNRASFSNYGTNCIDISAPGKRILTAYYDLENPELNNIYAYRSGTSFAAPIVSGAAALLRSYEPTLTWVQARDRIINMAEMIPELENSVCGESSCLGKMGSGRINLYNILTNTASVPDNDNTEEETNPETETPITYGEGTIITTNIINQYYIVNNGKKRLLYEFVINQRQLNLDSAAVITQEDFESIVLGTPLPPLENTLVKGIDSPLVYVVFEQTLRPLTYFSFISYGYEFSQVRTVATDLVLSLDKSGPRIPKAGTVLRSHENPTVYLSENEKLHPMNLEAFNNRSLSFSDVKFTDKTELDFYSVGAPYLE